jgi:O-antigen/teichoic acid export membrane protein
LGEAGSDFELSLAVRDELAVDGASLPDGTVAAGVKHTTAAGGTIPATAVAEGSEAFPRARSAIKRVSEKTTAMAVIDQAFYSGTTFCTSVLLGRMAGADGLGAYSLAFSIVVLVLCTHETLVTTPYTIYVHRQRAARQRRVAGSVLVQYSAISLVASLGFLAAGLTMLFVLQRELLGWAMLTLTAVIPLILIRELARKLAYAQLEVWKALLLDAGVSVVQLAVLLLLAASGALTALTAFLAIGLACFCGAVVWWMTVHESFRIRRRQVKYDVHRHWRLGRWIFAALLSLMLQNAVLMWLIAFVLGTGASGIFAACMSVIALSNPLVNAVGSVFTPQASRALHRGGSSEVWRIAVEKTILLAGVTSAFVLIVAFLGDDFIRLFYGPEYARQTIAITLLALVALAKALDTIAYSGLFVIERAALNLWINLGSLAALAFLAPWLMNGWATAGAAAALLIVSCAATVARWLLFTQALGKSRTRLVAWE